MTSKLKMPKNHSRKETAGHIGQLQQGLGSVGKMVASVISYQFKLEKVRYFVFILLDGIEKYIQSYFRFQCT